MTDEKITPDELLLEIVKTFLPNREFRQLIVSVVGRELGAGRKVKLSSGPLGEALSCLAAQISMRDRERLVPYFRVALELALTMAQLENRGKHETIDLR